jgi:hypothetical protein
MLARFVGWLLNNIGATLIGLPVVFVAYWLYAYWSGPATIEIDFQTSNGCPTGRLTDLARHFDDKNVRLEQGADRLVICDPDTLRTNSLNAPEDIARAFPGCLTYRSGSLLMLRASEAVCAVPSKNIFVCDGDVGGGSVGSVGNGQPSTEVPSCSNEELSRFGIRT